MPGMRTSERIRSTGSSPSSSSARWPESGDLHVETLVPEEDGQDGADVGVVLDDEDLRLVASLGLVRQVPLVDVGLCHTVGVARLCQP